MTHPDYNQPFSATKIFAGHLQDALAKSADSEPPRRSLDTDVRAVRDQADEARDQLATIPGIADSHATSTENIQANKQLTREARTEQIARTAGDAVTQMHGAIDGARDQLQQAHAAAVTAAMPALTPGQEMPARADAQLMLTGAESPEQKMEQMARGGDDVAALVTGPYGRRALEAAGLAGRDLDAAHGRVVGAALDTAAEAGNPAAAYAQHIANLQGIADVEAQSVVRHFGNDVRARHGVRPLVQQ